MTSSLTHELEECVFRFQMYASSFCGWLLTEFLYIRDHRQYYKDYLTFIMIYFDLVHDKFS